MVNQLLARFMKNVREHRNDPFIIDEDGRRRKTFWEVDLISGRVASYLKRSGIGKEDVVGIHLPKSMEYLAVELGVMKAGAAFLPLDYSAASDRRDFIIRDSDCRLLITPELFPETQREEPLEQPVETDPHDLSFIIYTSGSTGSPKGVGQEYGVYSMLMDSVQSMWNDIKRCRKDSSQAQFAMTPAPYFVASLELMGLSLVEASCLHVIPDCMLLDLNRFKGYISDNAIDVAFLTPSLIRKADNLSRYGLSVAILGAEPAINLYSERPVLVNVYSSSELAFVAAYFKADRLYENMPVGSRTGQTEIKLLDENGNPADKGEIYIKLPFFRGYHSMPEKTAEMIVDMDGKRFYHTGDIASVDQNGVYTVHGRADNMIKINGNRVEPGEVESAMYMAFPAISRVAVKGFLDKR